MKKTIVLFFALLMAGATFAQSDYDWRDKRHSISVSIGTPSFTSGITGIFSAIFTAIDSDTQVSLKPSYGIHYGFNALSWLRVGGSFIYGGWSLTDKSGGENLAVEDFHEFNFLARVDFTYLNRKYVRLYSGLEVGGILHMIDNYTYTQQNTVTNTERTYVPNVAFSATAIGLEAGGKHVYGLAEINIGNADLLRAGLGVRL